MFWIRFANKVSKLQNWDLGISEQNFHKTAIVRPRRFSDIAIDDKWGREERKSFV